jgi:PST family polysaccharide transporter
VWLFQGLERMKYITYVSLAGRAALTAAVFVFVSDREDYLRYAILLSTTSVLVGVASLVCAVKAFGVAFVRPSFEELRREAVDGWYVFVSSISIVLYTSSTTFVLGLFASNAVVGWYTGADKIRQAVQGLFTPVFQTLYPYVNKLAHESRERAIAFMRKEALALGIAGGIVCALVFAGAGPVVRIVLGGEYEPSVVLLRILAFAPVLIILGNVLTVQGMLSLNMKRDYSLVFVSAGIVGVAAIVYLTHRFAARGTALSVVAVEAFAIAMTLYRMRANGVSFFGARGGGNMRRSGP